MKNKKSFILVSLMLIYEEFMFSYLIFNDISNPFYKIIFSINIALIINLIVGAVSEKINRIVRNIIIGAITVLFSAQFIYYQVYQSIISVYSLANGGQVFQFWETILNVIKLNWNKIILLLFPNIISWGLCKTRKSKTSKISKIGILNGILAVTILHILALSAILFANDNGLYSVKNLYLNSNSELLTCEKFGIMTTMRLDFQKYITKKSDNTLMTVSTNFEEVVEEKIPEYNMQNIDWNSVIAGESNNTIKSMHEYFSVQQPTLKNEYTGMFKGKNVVVFVAEAFNEVAINKDITPTLYKLYSEGFQFDNFYTPLFPVSTADGEYITDTSLIPKEGIWSLSKLEGNYMPYSYPNVFEPLGYTSHAYHNHSADYYDRDSYIRGMGYDSYLARGNGLEKRMNCSHWPNSDLEMINATVDDYINDDKFLAYYMTVSGHLEYNTGGNYIANKNWNLVKDLPYSNKAKCYMATQIELDKAVEALINKLAEKGKLEDTVIIISGDHYPYGLTLNELNELSSYKKDDNFEKHRMPLLIWSGSMKEPIKVEKIGSSLDILPTVLNLFGIDYDSRLLMGNDILSNAEGLIIFSNRSFITSKGRYNVLNKIFYPIDGVEIPENYVDDISKIIYNKYQMSKMILENDYYRKLWDKINQINQEKQVNQEKNESQKEQEN